MNAPVWRVEDDGEVLLRGSPTSAESGLVSLPFLIAAVRRKWRLVAATAGVCALLALGLLQMGAGQHTASLTLLLISDPNADPTAAMATNESLLHTRSVAGEVVDTLGLPLSPEDFQVSVKATPMSNQLMAVTVSAPSDAEAITRINALTKVYLAFRAQQLSSAADTSIKANNKHIDDLTTQIDDLTKNYLAPLGTPGQQSLADSLLSQRSQLQSQLYDAQLANAQAQVQSQGIVDASHVVDAAAIVHKSRVKKAMFAVASGLIGGTALGLVLVLAPAILSTRLRRRDDVARALACPCDSAPGRSPVAGGGFPDAR